MSQAYSDLVRQALASASASPNGNWRASCPICVMRVGTPDRHRALSIRADSGVWYCWRCKSKGVLRGYVVADDSPPAERPAGPQEADSLPADFYELMTEPGRSALCLDDARRYLSQRGIADEMVAALGIGACALGRWAGRVVIPVRDQDGRLRTYVGRCWTKKAEMPYLYPRGGSRDYMFNEAAAFVDSDEPLYIVEGCFDAMALWPDGLAALGGVTRRHRETLARTRRPVVIVLDPDDRRGARQLLFQLLRAGLNVGQLDLPPGCDPDEVPASWIRQAGRQTIRRSPVKSASWTPGFRFARPVEVEHG